MNFKRLTPTAGKKLLIVGGCGGIGRAVMKGALDNELEVAIFDLPRAIHKFPPPAQVKVWSVDAKEKKELANVMEALLADWGQLDYLVNLAGYITNYGPVRDFTADDWINMQNGNLYPTLFACQLAIPHLRPGGAIVNMSSGLGFGGRPGYGPYSLAKAGLVSLTKTLASELAPHIRVNAVAPGAVQTAFLSGGLGHDGDEGLPPSRVDLEAYKKIVPLGTVASPEEIAAPILFLLGEGASHMTGQTLHINGGAMMV